MVVVHDEETTVLELRLEQVLAFHQDLVVLRHALHALEEAHVLNHVYQASSDVEVDGYMVE